MGRPYAKRYTKKCLGTCGKMFETTYPGGRFGLCPSCRIKVDQYARCKALSGTDQRITRKVAHTSMAN